MRAPITSRKHIIQHTQTTVASGAVASNLPILAQAVQDVNANFEVIEGSVIKAVYIERWIIGKGPSPTSYVLIVEKAPANAPAITFTQMTNLDSYPNKKNILFTSEGLLPRDDANAIPVLRQWLKIPKGKQRFGLKDELRIVVADIGVDDIEFCGLVIYKSYT